MLDLVDFCNSYFVGDAVMTDFYLNVLDCVTEEFITILDIMLTD